jgi:hypothetical protein
MPLAYYRRLSRADKRTYDASDRLHSVPLPAPQALAPTLLALDEGLRDNAHRPTQKASHQLVAELLAQLLAPPVTVRVLARRPSDEESELHGLYEMPERGRPIIRAWMRTAVHNRPVAFKSFLRTLLHEVVHHLDFTHFALAESFHTEGFFKREAHLARQLLSDYQPLPSTTKPKRQLPPRAAPPVPRAEQLTWLPPGPR